MHNCLSIFAGKAQCKAAENRKQASQNPKAENYSPTAAIIAEEPTPKTPEPKSSKHPMLQSELQPP